MEKTPTPFALFDDHAITAHGLKNILLRIDTLRFLFKAKTKSDLLASLRQKPELLIVSYPFADSDSEGIIEIVKQQLPTLKILVISFIRNPKITLKLIGQGANGVILSSHSINDLQDAVTDVMKKPYLFNDLCSEAMIDELRKVKKFKSHDDKYVCKEQDIQLMNYLWQELNRDEIADLLDIKRKSVDTYITTLIHNIGAHDQIGLIKFGIKNELIEI